MLCRIDGSNVRLSHQLAVFSWSTVYNSKQLASCIVSRVYLNALIRFINRPAVGQIFLLVKGDSRLRLPHFCENLFIFSHNRTFETHMHIMPRPNIWFAMNVIICNVHSSCINQLAINNHNLHVVSVIKMINIREL